ncbi:YciI family protein [Kribbella sp. NPDC051586]|uniref:YciI family protein n=1 Tax=Kribbella sp. NPDC051586 TaxID=3364118 RepID=UPI003787438D
MQFLVSVLDDKTNSATADEMTAISAFNERIIADGNWVFAGGLAAPGAATVVDNRGAEAIFTDGPYLESKEYIAGLWIMQAEDLETARKLVTEASKACNRRLEVRPFL